MGTVEAHISSCTEMCHSLQCKQLLARTKILTLCVIAVIA